MRQSRVRQAAVNVAETRASAIERAVAKSPNADVVLASASDVDLPRLSEVARRGFSPRAGQGPVFATAEGMALRSGQGNAFGGSGQGHAFGSGQGGAFDPTVAGSEDRPAMIEPRDIRHVADSRVPLYARPGEGAEILVELLRGEPVAILRDGATGWVQLNAIDGGTIGWAESRHLEPAGSATLASN